MKYQMIYFKDFFKIIEHEKFFTKNYLDFKKNFIYFKIFR